MNTPVAILVRVSTSEQNTSRQVHELTEVATASGWTVTHVVREEGVSGASKVRPGLDQVLQLAEAGLVKKVLVHEISRVSRNPVVLHGSVERFTEAGVSLYWHAQRTETLLPDGRRSPAAGLMIALLGEMARSERETMIERVKSGLAEARRKGRRLGRPQGSGLSTADLLEKHADVHKLLRGGHSIRHASRISGKGTSTVMRVARALKFAV